MNKKLLTAAIGAALVAGPMFAAHADVKVYGHLQFELANENVGDQITTGGKNEFLRPASWQGGNIGKPNGKTKGSVTTVEDNQRGRIGFYGDESVGGGMKAFGRVEYDITSSGNQSGFKDNPSIREANVGLSGGAGTFTIGTLKSPYKYTGGVKYDPFVTTNLEARRNGGMTGGNYGSNGFLSNMLSYQTAKGMPVDFWLAYSPSDTGAQAKGAGTAGANEGDRGDYAAALKFGGGGWEAFLATAKNKDNGASGSVPAVKSDYTATKIGGKVSFDSHTILGQYESTKEDNIDIRATSGVGTQLAGVQNEGKILFVGYHLKMGNNTFVAQYGDSKLKFKGYPTALEDQKGKYYTVGLIHSFSKTARLFGGYTKTELKNQSGVSADDADRTAFTVGLRKHF